MRKKKNQQDSEAVIQLEDKSLNLSPKALEQAAKKLRNQFKSLPKTLFQPGIPPPYVRSKDSRPLHFTEDGRFLMYFTKTEFIKLNLSTMRITLRRKVPRADLSPLYCEYTIWSRDSKRVLIVSSRLLKTPKSTAKIAYVYKTINGAYTRLPKIEFNIECFNPVKSNELILTFSLPIRTKERVKRRKRDYDTLWSWNYELNRWRLISVGAGCPIETYVMAHSAYIIVLQFLPPLEWGTYRGWHSNRVQIFSAKGLKRVVSFAFRHFYNPNFEFSQNQKYKDRLKFNLYRKSMHPFFSVIAQKRTGQVCLKYRDENFIILDALRRNLRSDFMSIRDTKSISSVLPMTTKFKNLWEGGSISYDGFEYLKYIFCIRICTNEEQIRKETGQTHLGKN